MFSHLVAPTTANYNDVKRRFGFAPIFIIAIVATLIIAGTIGYFTLRKPAAENSTPISTSTPSISAPISSLAQTASTTSKTEGFQLHQDETFGVEFSYPSNWVIRHETYITPQNTSDTTAVSFKVISLLNKQFNFNALKDLLIQDGSVAYTENFQVNGRRAFRVYSIEPIQESISSPIDTVVVEIKEYSEAAVFYFIGKRGDFPTPKPPFYSTTEDYIKRSLALNPGYAMFQPIYSTVDTFKVVDTALQQTMPPLLSAANIYWEEHANNMVKVHKFNFAQNSDEVLFAVSNEGLCTDIYGNAFADAYGNVFADAILQNNGEIFYDTCQHRSDKNKISTVELWHFDPMTQTSTIAFQYISQNASTTPSIYDLDGNTALLSLYSYSPYAAASTTLYEVNLATQQKTDITGQLGNYGNDGSYLGPFYYANPHLYIDQSYGGESYGVDVLSMDLPSGNIKDLQLNDLSLSGLRDKLAVEGNSEVKILNLSNGQIISTGVNEGESCGYYRGDYFSVGWTADGTGILLTSVCGRRYFISLNPSVAITNLSKPDALPWHTTLVAPLDKKYGLGFRIIPPIFNHGWLKVLSLDSYQTIWLTNSPPGLTNSDQIIRIISQ